MPNGFQYLTEPVMYGIAKRVARSRPELWDDLVQEGWLKLLNVQMQPHTNPSAFYRLCVQRGMIDFLRRQHDERVISFAQAKRFGLLHCPSCYSSNIAWTIFWPSLVRCRDCIELFSVEDPGV